MGSVTRTVCALCACLALPGRLLGQALDQPRRLSARETGCDSVRPASADSVYQADGVDRPAKAPYVRVDAMPYRMRDVQAGRTMLRFVVDSAGWVDRCTIALVEESSSDWTDAVLPELRRARFEPARKGARRVRQVVYQVFIYHSDGRTSVSQ